MFYTCHVYSDLLFLDPYNRECSRIGTFLVCSSYYILHIELTVFCPCETSLIAYITVPGVKKNCCFFYSKTVKIEKISLKKYGD